MENTLGGLLAVLIGVVVLIVWGGITIILVDIWPGWGVKKEDRGRPRALRIEHPK